MILLKTEDLCKTYGTGENLIKAVDKINIEINKGDFIGIVGTSGSGKTTLLNLLSGLDIPSAGKVLYPGLDIDPYKERDLSKFRGVHVGFVFQFYNLIPILSAQENIYLPLMINNQQPDVEYIDTLVNTLGIRSKLHMPIAKLSGGQQQRIAIARALAHKPSILFADEPTGSLDTATSRDIITLFQTVNEQFGQTIVIVTHDPLVAGQCRRIITIEDGRVTQDCRSKK